MTRFFWKLLLARCISLQLLPTYENATNLGRRLTMEARLSSALIWRAPNSTRLLLALSLVLSPASPLAPVSTTCSFSD